MPPKARRPAARVEARRRGGLRRPAGPRAGERDADPGGDPSGLGARGEAEFDVAGFERGVESEGYKVPLRLWKKGLKVLVTEGLYWEEKVKVAGLVDHVSFNGEVTTLWLDLRGSQSEALVKWRGLHPKKLLEVDLCRPGCLQQSKDGLLHAQKIRVWLPEVEEAWMTNLEGMDRGDKDELEALRRRAGGLEEPPGVAPKVGEAIPDGSSSEGDRKKKKKRSGKKKKKEKVRAQGSKPLKDLFEKTGLDPDPILRKKLLKQAKKIARKRNRRSSSSGSSSSSSEDSSIGEAGTSGIFGHEVRVMSVWNKTPGCLTQVTLDHMQRALVQQTGQPWELDRGSLPPVFSQYWRSVLDARASRPMSREMQTLSYVLDLLLQGRAAAACDVATQRLKSLEQTSTGGDFRISQRQELVPAEMASMSSTVETLEASRLQREEVKARAAGKGWDRRYGKGDADSWEVKGKYKKGDNPKGKGKGHKGDGRKGDGKKGEEEKEKKQ